MPSVEAPGGVYLLTFTGLHPSGGQEAIVFNTTGRDYHMQL